MPTSPSAALLAQLIGFPSVSLTPNMALIAHVQQLLAQAGIASSIVKDASGTRANLFASTGPADVSGIVLSGHTDVVPVQGQAWSTPAFEASQRDGRIYGRGAADMKGFVACAVQAMLRAAQQPLVRPLQLALSYDEEIGCVGVRSLLHVLAQRATRPMLCIVGEPTMMQLAIGHKGKAAYRAICLGQEGHSALAPSYVNAIHVAADFIQGLRTVQQQLALTGRQDADYDIPYSTLHVGKIAGGKALNIVANECSLDFEIRTVHGEQPEALLQCALEQTQRIMTASFANQPQALLPDIQSVNAYPGLQMDATAAAVQFVRDLLPPETTQLKVAFGTEGGLFQQVLHAPVIVCGPGSINMAHKPDEYVELAQLEQCDRFLDALIARLCA